MWTSGKEDDEEIEEVVREKQNKEEKVKEEKEEVKGEKEELEHEEELKEKVIMRRRNENEIDTHDTIQLQQL